MTSQSKAVAAGLALALAMTASLAGQAGAQLAPGRSGISTVLYMGAEEAMKELAMFGRCYGRNQRKQALSLIVTSPGSREEAQTYRRLFGGESQPCLTPGTTLSAPLEYIRGAIAEGLFRSGEAVPAEYRLAAPGPGEARNLGDIARCYAAAHVAEAHAVLATRVGSRAEYEAVSGVMEGFEACIPPGGRIRADATVIRFRLAEAMYRLGVQAPAPAGS